MAKLDKTTPPPSIEPEKHSSPGNDVFALENVTQLREAIDQAVYGDKNATETSEEDRVHTVEALTTLGQMGILTETDIDEAKKGYL